MSDFPLITRLFRFVARLVHVITRRLFVPPWRQERAGAKAYPANPENEEGQGKYPAHWEEMVREAAPHLLEEGFPEYVVSPREPVPSRSSRRSKPLARPRPDGGARQSAAQSLRRPSAELHAERRGQVPREGREPSSVAPADVDTTVYAPQDGVAPSERPSPGPSQRDRSGRQPDYSTRSPATREEGSVRTTGRRTESNDKHQVRMPPISPAPDASHQKYGEEQGKSQHVPESSGPERRRPLGEQADSNRSRGPLNVPYSPRGQAFVSPWPEFVEQADIARNADLNAEPLASSRFPETSVRPHPKQAPRPRRAAERSTPPEPARKWPPAEDRISGHRIARPSTPAVPESDPVLPDNKSKALIEDTFLNESAREPAQRWIPLMEAEEQEPPDPDALSRSWARARRLEQEQEGYRWNE